MDLAKDRADVGLFTNQLRSDARVLLRPTRACVPGNSRHRQSPAASLRSGRLLAQINTSAKPLPPRTPGGYQALVIAASECNDTKRR